MLQRLPTLLTCTSRSRADPAKVYEPEPKEVSDPGPSESLSDPGPSGSLFIPGPKRPQLSRSNVSMMGRQRTPFEHLIDEHVAHGTHDALPRVRKVLDTGFEAIGSAMPYHRLPLAFRLLYNQCKDEGRYLEPLGRGDRCQGDAAFYQRALRCLKLAGAAYASSEKAEIASAISGITANHIRHVQDSKCVQCPNFFIAVDPVLDAIVLSVRGTSTIADVFTDVLISPANFLGQKAHSGVLQSAIAVNDIAKPILERLIESNPNRKVIFVGHSLGAATAIMAVLDCFQEDSELYHLMEADKVECWAFGPPPVLSRPDLLPECMTRNTYTFVHNFDIVPRACPVAICKLLLALDNVHQQKFWRFQRLLGQAGRTKLPDFIELNDEQVQRVEDALGRYQHTGHLRLLRHGEFENGKQALAEELDHMVTHRCLVHPHMAKDHLVGSYESVLKELAGCQEAGIATAVPFLRRQSLHLDRADTF